MKKRICIHCITHVFISCKKEIADKALSTSANESRIVSPSDIITTKADYYDDLFTRFGVEWTGGDGANSYRLPDGRDLWLFGDSFIDTVRPGRTRPVYSSTVHNCMAYTTSKPGEFVTVCKGTLANPQAYFVPDDPDEFYWPAHCFTSKNNKLLYVSLVRVIANGNGDGFGFNVLGTDIATLSLPSLSILKIDRFTNGNRIDWTSAIMEDSNYVYIYGAESTQFNKFMHVARTTKTDPVKDLRYWNGKGWTKDSSQSIKVRPGVSESYSVFKDGGKYYLLTQGILLSPNIYIYDGPSPVGPFENRRLVYTTPYATSSCITYNAVAHTQFTQDGKLLVGYSSNSNDATELYNKADTYRPYFVWAENWQ